IAHRFRRRPQVKVLQGELEKVDFEQRALQVSSVTSLKLDYDYLILATGSQSRFLDVPGAAEHSWPMRTLEEAVALRDRLHRCFKQHPASRLPLGSPSAALTFTIVGGGPTGLELAGALARLLEHQGYRLGQTARIVLIQSGDRLLKSYPKASGHYAARWLKQRGIELRLGHRVTQVSERAIVLSAKADFDGEGASQTSEEILATHTVIWTAGLEGNRPESPQALPTAGSKLKVKPTLQLEDYPQVYSAGDLSHVLTQAQDLNGVAQEAIQQGRTAAENILRQRAAQAPAAFDYNDKGRLAIIGRGAGVGLIKNISLNGPLGGMVAWLLWLEVHWFYLPGWRNRLSVLRDWLLPKAFAQSLFSHPQSQSTFTPSHPTMLQTYLPLVGRSFLTSIFIYAGINNLLNFSSTAEGIGAMLPAPELALAGNILCCLLGSLSLILGFKARWGAILLILFLLPTTFIFHPFWSDSSETIAFLKNLSLVGALLFVFAYGAGPVSLDSKASP
ncbi:MAG: FAD-dependent oxidoreductase, partial [Cyanobacteria bacterium P01_A01_bin.135]